MIEEVHFKKGDLVPDWVLRAENPSLQSEATFASDVIASRQHSGEFKVTVRPLDRLNRSQVLVRISVKGCACRWAGAPTFLNTAPTRALNSLEII
jgi:hypothetical protein